MFQNYSKTWNMHLGQKAFCYLNSWFLTPRNKLLDIFRMNWTWNESSKTICHYFSFYVFNTHVILWVICKIRICTLRCTTFVQNALLIAFNNNIDQITKFDHEKFSKIKSIQRCSWPSQFCLNSITKRSALKLSSQSFHD